MIQKIKKLTNDITSRGIASHVVLGWVQYELLPCYYSLADLVIYCGTSDAVVLVQSAYLLSRLWPVGLHVCAQ